MLTSKILRSQADSKLLNYLSKPTSLVFKNGNEIKHPIICKNNLYQTSRKENNDVERATI